MTRVSFNASAPPLNWADKGKVETKQQTDIQSSWIMKFFFMAIAFMMKNWPQRIALLSITKMQAFLPPPGTLSVQAWRVLVPQGGLSVLMGGVFVQVGSACILMC